jgi:N-acetylglucosaminyldiphosphoundecaprenol N-acetyl-beta-D-mannosaminyltransferase
VAEEAASALRARYPGARIVGTYAPPVGPFTPAEDETICRMIQEMQPDLLFVAFGAPKQDLWIRAHMERLGVPVCVGVGGSFDILAGRVNRAPLWMQNRGLEWLYRMMQEPRRLWRRYLVQDLPIFFQLMAQRAAGPAGGHAVDDGRDDAAVPVGGALAEGLAGAAADGSGAHVARGY